MTADTSIRNHWWWRPGWREGRSAYTWHVTTDLHPALDQLADACRPALEPLATLDVIPTRWLHLTMQGVGFTDEVTNADLGSIITAARGRCERLAPFTVTLGPAEVGSEGCALHARPADPLTVIRGQLRAAIGEVWGADRIPEAEAFRPHVSLAYNNTDAPARPLAEQLASRPVDPVTVTVRSVQLIDLNRDQRVYTWTTIASAPLGGE